MLSNSEAATGHVFRPYLGRSARCWCCGQVGPSPQTGEDECGWCRVCRECASSDVPARQVCSVSGVLEEGDDVPVEVRWSTSAHDVLVTLSGADPGSALVLIHNIRDETETQSSCTRVSYHPSPPCLKLGNQQTRHYMTIPLPAPHVLLSDTLAELALVLNQCGVPHDVPAAVDDDLLPLPHIFGGFSGSPVVTCALSANGRYALTAHADGTLRLAEVRGAAQGTLVWTRLPPRHAEPVSARACAPHQVADLSPSTERIAVAGATNALLLHAMSGEIIKELHTDFPTQATSLCFSPCGRYLLAVSSSHTAYVFDGRTGTPISSVSSASLVPYNAGLWCCRMSAAGGFLALSAQQESEHGVALVGGWRTGAPSVFALTGKRQTQRTVSLQFNSADTELLCAGADGAITVWSVAPGEGFCAQLREIAHSLSPGAMLCSASIVGGGGRIVGVDSEGNLWCWDSRGLRTTLPSRPPPRAGEQSVPYLCADVAPRGRICCGRANGTVAVCALPPRVVDVDPRHPDNTMNTRAVQRHDGQRPLLLFLCWQTRLRERTAALPEGLTALRLVSVESMKNVAAFLPNPFAGDVCDVAGSDQCSVM